MGNLWESSNIVCCVFGALRNRGHFCMWISQYILPIKKQQALTQRISCWGLKELWIKWVTRRKEGSRVLCSWWWEWRQQWDFLAIFFFFPENTIHATLAYTWLVVLATHELQCSQRTHLILWQENQRQRYLLGGVLETHMLECILPLSEIQGNEKESSISYASAQGEEPSWDNWGYLQPIFAGNTLKERKPA